jgi:hypothetical protein
MPGQPPAAWTHYPTACRNRHGVLDAADGGLSLTVSLTLANSSNCQPWQARTGSSLPQTRLPRGVVVVPFLLIIIHLWKPALRQNKLMVVP